eukprot:gene10623-19363_t
MLEENNATANVMLRSPFQSMVLLNYSMMYSMAFTPEFNTCHQQSAPIGQLNFKSQVRQCRFKELRNKNMMIKDELPRKSLFIDTSIPGLNEASNRQSQIKETEKQIDDEPILECFTIDLRHEIGRRLDVYLKGLSNWKDLAGVFRIKDEPELRSLLRTKEPTMSLLDIIAGQGVTVGQLKLALEKIDRCDVVNFIDKYLSSVF